MFDCVCSPVEGVCFVLAHLVCKERVCFVLAHLVCKESVCFVLAYLECKGRPSGVPEP